MIILASNSPRRRELLSYTVDSFEIITAPSDESLGEMTPCEGVAEIARRKGHAVLMKLRAESDAADENLIISADTLVELDGKALGKPHDIAEAHAMLSRLSGRVHNVHTGVAVHYRGRVLTAHETTAVKFKTLTDAEIDRYIATGEPMDKAGGYGIQGLGGRLVEEIHGEYDNVVGLPCKLLRRLMEEIRQDEKG